MAIANLRTFNQEELLHVLSNCAHSLAYAYQKTELESFYEASFEATMACEFLRCELAVNNKHYRIQ